LSSEAGTPHAEFVIQALRAGTTHAGTVAAITRVRKTGTILASAIKRNGVEREQAIPL
jgi:hypothetical protein